jgi:hypothetical protein
MIRQLFAASTILFCGAALASGGGPDFDSFVLRSGTDIDLARYQNGVLGVVLPTYERVYLYTAWRSVMLAAQGKSIPAAPEGALLRALGNRNGGWFNGGDVSKAYDPWLEAVNGALKQNIKPANKFYYLNCPASSYAFATSTLNELARRSDATPARLAAWVATQQQVFKICGDDPASQRPPYDDGRQPKVPLPTPLPASEALYWRQMQQYQLATAAFYAGDYASSQRQFEVIGATEQHPLRQWGQYLSLRSQARAAAAKADNPEQRVAAIRAGAERILANPSLAPLHEATRALLRAALARVTPAARIQELSKILDNPAADPYQEDVLGDWRVLANRVMPPDGEPALAALAPQLRSTYGFIDWIQTIQSCAYSRSDEACKAAPAHALEQWRRFSASGAATDKALARVWLLAAAMLFDQPPQPDMDYSTMAAEKFDPQPMPSDLEQALLKVADSAPEYLTLRYALARHYRLAHQPAKGRALEETVLNGPQLSASRSPGARNLFLQERFALANSPADAAPYLVRTQSHELDADTGEASHRDADDPRNIPIVAADGLRWLNQGLTAADLLALAGQSALPTPLRANLALAAWMRADLLAQQSTAEQAAKLAASLAPGPAPQLQSYLQAGTPAERRHVMLLAAVRYSLSPVIANGYPEQHNGRREDDMLADQWCSIPGTRDGWLTAVERAPRAPDTGNAAARDKELAALGQLKTSTGFIGDYALQRAKSTPQDPDLPWLLHVVVLSTRGGCLDPDAGALSRAAFKLLHSRYKNSEWTSKTPYFY